MQPKVSVIIPVYNVEIYLRQCLDSILNQTLKEIEIICVDDGSTDKSLNLLYEYSNLDARVKVISQKNKNAGCARNIGLHVSTGEYLSFLDADDFYEQEMLEIAYKKAIENSADIVVYGSKTYIEDKDKYESREWSINKKVVPVNKSFVANEISTNFFMNILGYAWDKLFKRELIEREMIRFQEQAVFNDSYFTYAALLTAKNIVYCDKILAYQRKRATNDSITNKRSKFYKCGYDFLKEIRNFMIQKNIYEKYEREYINYCVHILYIDLLNKTEDMREIMIDCLKYNWLAELKILNKKDYFYNEVEYEKLMKMIYSKSEFFYRDNDDTIPVVYATDKNYLKYAVVSIMSILLNSSKRNQYRFIILIDDSVSLDDREKVYDTFSEFRNYTLEFIEIKNVFNDAYLGIKHITTPTYFRLLLPSLLPDCDKCIYLDGDTIICGDLNKLYSIDMGDNLVAGVPAYVYYKSAEHHRVRLGYNKNDNFDYVNAGVLLFNLSELRKENVEKLFIKLVDNKYASQDQDIINVACKNRIILLPFAFNVMTKYNSWTVENFSRFTTKEDILSGRKKPIVIHYADKRKPWDDFMSTYAKEWLSVALCSKCWRWFEAEKKDLLLSTMYNKNTKKRVAKKSLKQLIFGGIKCYKEHGLFYTVRRITEKMKQ